MSLLWQPTPDVIATSQLTRFQKRIEAEHNVVFGSYDDLHRWSLENPDAFWSGVWEFCELRGEVTGPITEPSNHPFGIDWFPNTTLNFAENLLRFRDDKIALVGLLEDGRREEWSYPTLPYCTSSRIDLAKTNHILVLGPSCWIKGLELPLIT